MRCETCHDSLASMFIVFNLSCVFLLLWVAATRHVITVALAEGRYLCCLGPVLLMHGRGGVGGESNVFYR